MKIKSYSIFLTFCWIFAFSISSHCYPNNENNGTSRIIIDFNDCEADVTGTNENYDEFTAREENSESGPEIELIGNRLYRNNPSENPHSCVLGLDFTSAMCVGASSSCLYEAGSARSVRFDVKITSPQSSGALLNNLHFYESSPRNFAWLGGSSGSNNYPTKYGVRVLRGGNVIYERSDISSTRGFSLESFDFDNNPNFEVNGSAIFNFELLPYCPVNNGANISIWDLEDLVVEAISTPSSEHNIVGGPFTFCSGDGSPDLIDEDSIVLNGEGSLNSQWIITDANGQILLLPQSFTEINFDLTGEGSCNIYHLNYSGSISGLFIGSNVENLIGIFDLTNSIEVKRNEVSGGQLTGGPFSFCVGDGLPDIILYSDLSLSQNKGSLNQWIITDTQGKIIGLPPSLSNVDFDEAGIGICLLWNLGYESGVSGISLENNVLTDLSGCYDLSNPVTINRGEVVGGLLSGGPFTFCVGDGEPDVIAEADVSITSNSGGNFQWVITDETGLILGLPGNLEDVNFDETEGGNCLIWHLSFEENISGLINGNNINNDLNGCYDLSNSVKVERTGVQKGILTGGPFSFCADGIKDTISTNEITLSGNIGSQSKWLVTDTSGKILALPSHYSEVDFDAAGVGLCWISHLSSEGMIQGDTIGGNTNDIVGCHALSNSILVTRSISSGGMLTGGPFNFCVDGLTDTIDINEITLSGNVGSQSQWVITDTSGNILGLPPHYSSVDFDAAGVGSCLIWHLSSAGNLQGDTVGGNTNDIIGCHEFSNSVAVTRTTPGGGLLIGGPFSFCVDGIRDTIATDDITLSGNIGSESQWLVTDTTGNILGKPLHFSNVDFDAAGVGICLIWHLSSEGSIPADTLGGNVNDFIGCHALSNPITVIRSTSSGGILTGGPFSFCVDDLRDTIGIDEIILSENTGSVSQWLITDTLGNILGKPSHFSNVDFDVAGVGVCMIWHLSSAGSLQGDSVGGNINNMFGCHALSNSITVTRSTPSGGLLTGGPFSFCVDDLRDTIGMDEIILSENRGSESQWLVTDTSGNILGKPPHFSNVDFDAAGVGICLIWHLSSENSILGDTIGGNANDIIGCHSLSNPITIKRSIPTSGILTGGPFSFCVDDLRDTIGIDEITLTDYIGSESQWLVTDTSGNILGKPPHFSNVDFDAADVGICLIWHLSSAGSIQGDTIGGSTTNIIGCHALSNPITVTRSSPNGGMLTGGPFSFCMDGQRDTIGTIDITLSSNTGSVSQWLVTDTSGNILGKPPHFSNVDFDAAGVGTCLIWHLSSEGNLEGDTVGGNTNNILGCHALSNPITVIRSTPSGGLLTGGPFSFCIDGQRDTIGTEEVTLSGNLGSESQWLVTDTSGTILGKPPHFSNVDFDAAGVGICLIWHLSSENSILGDTIGGNANNIIGCHALSNPITVTRSAPSGGMLSGGPFHFCVDGIRDTIDTDEIMLSGNIGSESQWLVTDTSGNILGKPAHFSNVDFDAAGVGICLIWHLSSEGILQGDTVGGNANDILGCHALSNPVTVTRSIPSGGTLTGGPFSFCVDGIRDTIGTDEISLSGNIEGESQWLITDTSGNILGNPPHFSDVDFDMAGVGICLIWHLSADGSLQGDTVGGNLSNFRGCHALSNSITVSRSIPNGGTLAGGPFSFCVDGIRDTIGTDEITIFGNVETNSQWLVTDKSGNILGKPPHFSNIDFDAAGVGICLIWHLSSEGSLEGDTVGGNINDIIGCHAFSNSITVTRSIPNGGMITGGPFSFCVDGLMDTIARDEIELLGNVGIESQWLVTDTSGNILGKPPHFSNVDFDAAGVGICLIWHLSSEGNLQGDTIGGNTSDITGCHALSNSITVTRDDSGESCPSQNLLGVPIINEVNSNGNVELKNVGNDTIDVSPFFLCNFPNYMLIDSASIICGSKQIAPGEYVTIDASLLNYGPDDGEIGLYKDDVFSQASSILDYLEWGSTGHGRSVVAVNAEIWTMGTFIEAFSNGMSLLYDGEGDDSTDWIEGNSSDCEENILGIIQEQDHSKFSFSISPNPVSEFATLTFSNKEDATRGLMYIYDQSGALRMESIVAVEDGVENQINLSHLEQGVYFIKVFSSEQSYYDKFIVH